MTRYHHHGTIVTNFTDDEAYAALCVFEWLMDRWTEGRKQVGGKELDKVAKAVTDAFEDNGWTEMRYAAMRVAVFVEAVHKAFNKLDEQLYDNAYSAYDWEFVPAVCRMLDWPALVVDYNWKQDPDAYVAIMVATHAMNLKAA